MKRLFILLFSIAMTAQIFADNNLQNSSSFIENKGQWPEEVVYLTQLNGVNAWITKSGVVYDYYKLEKNYTQDDLNKQNPTMQMRFMNENTTVSGHVISMKLKNVANVTARGFNKSETVYNYFIGNDNTKWAKNVSAYNTVELNNVAEGIGVRYYFDNNNLRYDYLVSPQADVAQLVFELEGEESFSVNEKGELTIKTSLGEVFHGKLYAYQSKKEVECGFKVNESGKLTLTTGDYDPSQELIIDPLVYSTFIGGTDTDYPRQMELGEKVYIMGYLRSADFPVTSGAYQSTIDQLDGFYQMFNKSGGEPIASTFIGGNGDDYLEDLVVDEEAGFVYLGGYSYSSNFPMAGNSYNTIAGSDSKSVIAKLSIDGTSLNYSTYFGSAAEADLVTLKVYNNKLYFAGFCYNGLLGGITGDFQSDYGGGDADGFVAILDYENASLDYLSFVGGSSLDEVQDIYITGENEFTILGSTESTDFGVTDNAYSNTNQGESDIFIRKYSLTENGDVIYSTYIGGSDSENAYSFDSDGKGFMGRTSSTNFPTTADAYKSGPQNSDFDALYTIMNDAGDGLVFSTTYGGNNGDYFLTSVKTADNCEVFVGTTSSEDFPTTDNALYASANGGIEAIVVKMNKGNGILLSTYLGGLSSESGRGIANSNETYYVLGTTTSSNFPSTPYANDPTFNGGYDGFYTVFSAENSVLLTDSEWTFDLLVHDAYIKSGQTLTIGQKTGATDGLDNSLGEVSLPAVPPSGNFDARLLLPDAETSASVIDFRSVDEEMMEWEFTAQPEDVGGMVDVNWVADDLPAIGRFIIYNANIPSQQYDMRNTEYLFIDDFPAHYVITYNKNTESAEVNVNEGWNMLSFPLQMDDMLIANHYTNATSAAFIYDGSGYAATNSVATGVGFWLKNEVTEQINFEGYLSSDDVAVTNGWNLVAPFHEKVAADNVSASSIGGTVGVFYGFNDGYFIADTLEPGQAYWVKTDFDGTLLFNSEVAKVNTNKAKPFYAIGVNVADDKGGKMDLTIGLDPNATNGFDKNSFDVLMPPAPPAGVFNASLVLADGKTTAMKDFRNGNAQTEETVEYLINWQKGKDASKVTLTIDIPKTGGEVSMELRDNVTGKLFTANAEEGVNEVVIDNEKINGLLLAVSYSSPVTTELTSFTAEVAGNAIALNWAVDAEADLKGFAVERKSETTGFSEIATLEGNTFAYSDNNVSAGKYSYRIKMISVDGAVNYSNTVEAEFLPTTYSLEQNYPNPFNPSTTIKFSIPEAGNTRLEIYNILGEKVATLIDGTLEAGVHTYKLNASELQSGLYIYRITSGNYSNAKKMMLLK